MTERLVIFLRGRLGPLDSTINEYGEACLFRLSCNYRLLGGGSDKTRTRYLWRDRGPVHIVITIDLVISHVNSCRAIAELMPVYALWEPFGGPEYFGHFDGPQPPQASSSQSPENIPQFCLSCGTFWKMSREFSSSFDGGPSSYAEAVPPCERWIFLEDNPESASTISSPATIWRRQGGKRRWLKWVESVRSSRPCWTLVR